MSKIIAVASGKGGTGKTTTVAAVSSCLAALGHKTLCIDFDVGMNNLDLSLGMSEFSITDFMDVVEERVDITEAANECPNIENLFFLGAPINDSSDRLDEKKVKNMFKAVRDSFDYCLVDLASGVGEYFQLAHQNADMSLIVTIGELPAIKGAEMAAMKARDFNVTDLRLLVNRVFLKSYKGVEPTIDEVIDTVGAQLLGLIREDYGVVEALHSDVPLVLFERRLAAYDFLDAARRITGESIPTRFISTISNYFV